MILMNKTENQEQRAKNIIWNAAGDYTFPPDFEAFDADGEADLYFNCIIGSVHRFYDYSLLHDLFLRMGRMPEAELYRSLLWLGLEQCTYEKALPDRPVLSQLRILYARKVVDRACSYWDQDLFDRLNTAHFAYILGEKARLGRKEKRLLAALEFAPSMNTEEIVEAMCGLLKDFFRCRLPRLDEKNLRFRFPVRFRKAALYGNLVSVSASDSSVSGSNASKPGHTLTLYLPVLYAQARYERFQTWLEQNFGISVYTIKERQELERHLCTDGHKNCRLHVTRGVFRKEAALKPSAQYRAMMHQKEQNLRFYQEHLSRNMLNISRLTERILRSLRFDSGRSPLRGRSGILMPDRIWRAVRLNDDRIFQRTEPNEKGNLSVDILLDASASQRDRQERIASQGYIIAESLSRCGLPVRVCSYCTVNGCTILHMFRDYNESQNNQRIFEYYAAGWNRDGLAVRIAGKRILDSPYENRLLIILSDCSPNDDHKFFSREKQIPFYYDYGKERGILDTAREVSLLRRQGISVLAVCTGRERDLAAARQIYGKDVVWAKSEERFADAVGYLIQEKIRYY